MLADIPVVIWERIAGVLPPTPAYRGNLPDVERGMETPTDQALVVSPARDTRHGLRHL